MGTWVNVPGSCVYVDVADKFHITCVSNTGQIYQWIDSSNSWIHIEGPLLTKISISVDNRLAGIDLVGNIYYNKAANNPATW